MGARQGEPSGPLRERKQKTRKSKMPLAFLRFYLLHPPLLCVLLCLFACLFWGKPPWDLAYLYALFTHPRLGLLVEAIMMPTAIENCSRLGCPGLPRSSLG